MIYGVIILVALALAVAAILLKRQRKAQFTAQLPSLSDKELSAVFDHASNVHAFIPATEEMKKRNLDIGFLKLQFIEMILANNQTPNRIGWAALKQFFGEEHPEIDYSTSRPGPDAFDRICEIKAQMQRPR